MSRFGINAQSLISNEIDHQDSNRTNVSVVTNHRTLQEQSIANEDTEPHYGQMPSFEKVSAPHFRWGKVDGIQFSNALNQVCNRIVT